MPRDESPTGRVSLPDVREATLYRRTPGARGTRGTRGLHSLGTHDDGSAPHDAELLYASLERGVVDQTASNEIEHHFSVR